jgi:isoquinoline 1-oxidoreductase alpha subunit
MTQLKINGQSVQTDSDPATPLLWVLRDHLNLTGTKFGCGIAACGACTVHLNGQAIRACVTPVSAAAAGEIRTIESMADDPVGRVVQEAWVKNDVVQCGYCQSGQVMAATALLKVNRRPTDADIDRALAGNLCRCGTYQRVRTAVKDAARQLG